MLNNVSPYLQMTLPTAVIKKVQSAMRYQAFGLVEKQKDAKILRFSHLFVINCLHFVGYRFIILSSSEFTVTSCSAPFFMIFTIMGRS